MGEPRLYKILGSFVLVGVITFAFVVAIGDSTSEYNTTENRTDELETIQSASENFQNKSREIQNESTTDNFLLKSLDDLTGGIFSKAIGVFGAVYDFIGDAVKTFSAVIALSGLPRGASYLISVMTSLFIIVLTFVVFAKMYFKVRL